MSSLKNKIAELQERVKEAKQKFEDAEDSYAPNTYQLEQEYCKLKKELDKLEKELKDGSNAEKNNDAPPTTVVTTLEEKDTNNEGGNVLPSFQEVEETKMSRMEAGRTGNLSTTTVSKSSSPQPAFALDCEFIQVLEDGNNEHSKVVVSIGIVDNQLEKILYSRIRKPRNSSVLDDSFVRTRGGLNRDWNKGIGIQVTQELIRDFAIRGGILVGWELQGDLGALGFVEAQRRAKDVYNHSEGISYLGERTDLPLDVSKSSSPTNSGNSATVTATIVELTDIYRTKTGKKCQLGECYKFIFGRSMNAHNAGDDARMTMELYNYWIQSKSPPSIPITSLCWHVVNVHTFQEIRLRKNILWDILRPIRGERDYVIEEKPREGVTTYKLKFRAEEERDGYLMLVRSRVRHHMNLRTYELSWKETDDVGDHIDCTAFKIHVYNKER